MTSTERRACRSACVVAVVGLSHERCGERIQAPPLDDSISVSSRRRSCTVLLSGEARRCRSPHMVDRIEAAAEQAGSEGVAVERNAERDTLPVRMRLAALTMYSGVTWLSVPYVFLPSGPSSKLFEASH